MKAATFRQYTQEEIDEMVKHFTNESVMSKIHNNDPILKKWTLKFFQYKYKNLDSEISLSEYVNMMERDEKLKDIIE